MSTAAAVSSKAVFTITPSGAVVIHHPVESLSERYVKFDAAFIERRMQQHRELQERMERELEDDIIREVRALED